MNIQERIETLETEFNEKIKALKAEAQREDEFPQDGDMYWYIDNDGEVMEMEWQGNEYDQGRLSIDNVFHTKEQAEFAVEKLKVEAELRKLSDSWDLENTQYSFSFNWENGEFEIEYPDYNQYPNSYYFYSINSLELAIETIGKERIKKYLFGVED